MAARWTTPAATTPTYKAMKMYRNYDGNRSAFGDTSVAATVPDPNTLAAFAAQRSADGALTVMVDQQGAFRDDAGDHQRRPFCRSGNRAGVAVDVSECDHPWS